MVRPGTNQEELVNYLRMVERVIGIYGQYSDTIISFEEILEEVKKQLSAYNSPGWETKQLNALQIEDLYVYIYSVMQSAGERLKGQDENLWNGLSEMFDTVRQVLIEELTFSLPKLEFGSDKKIPASSSPYKPPEQMVLFAGFKPYASVQIPVAKWA